MASDKKLRKQQAVDERERMAGTPSPKANREREKWQKFHNLARNAEKIKRAERPDPLA